MWLQIAFLVLAVLALVRPALRVLTSGGQNIAIIVDASGSMAGTDVKPFAFRARACRSQSPHQRTVDRRQRNGYQRRFADTSTRFTHQ
jgi:hypothetical protein